MIRFVDSLDTLSLPQLQKLGDAFVKESGATTKFDIDQFTKSMDLPLTMGIAGLWVIETEDNEIVGVLGGLCTPMFFSEEKVAIEAFWYVREDHRHGTGGFRLLEEFERWAKNVGAQYVHLAFMNKIHPEKMSEFYERRGYTKLETIYRKTLWQ